MQIEVTGIQEWTVHNAGQLVGFIRADEHGYIMHSPMWQSQSRSATFAGAYRWFDDALNAVPSGAVFGY